MLNKKGAEAIGISPLKIIIYSLIIFLLLIILLLSLNFVKSSSDAKVVNYANQIMGSKLWSSVVFSKQENRLVFEIMEEYYLARKELDIEKNIQKRNELLKQSNMLKELILSACKKSVEEALPSDIYVSEVSLDNLLKPEKIKCIVFLESDLSEKHVDALLEQSGFINNKVSYEENVMSKPFDFSIFAGVKP